MIVCLLLWVLCSMCHKFTLFLSSCFALQTKPATNRLSLPEATKQMLHRTSRKRAPSWLCYWSAYHHFSLYSAPPPLCCRGHLYPTWPESAEAAGNGARFGWSAFAYNGASAQASQGTLYCFLEIYLSGLSPSVSEKKKKVDVGSGRDNFPSQTFN